MSDYLWDKSGPVDPLAADFEAALAPLASGAGTEMGSARARQQAAQRRRNHRNMRIAGGVTLLAMVAATTLLLIHHRTRETPDTGVRFVSGDATVQYSQDSHADRPTTSPGPDMNAHATPSRFAPNQVLGHQASIQAIEETYLTLDGLGSVSLAPGSILRVLAKQHGVTRVALQNGRLHARVTAPPRLFVVDTPLATAVDLGCEYTLTTTTHHTVLRVISGSVEMQLPPELQAQIGTHVVRVPERFELQLAPAARGAVPTHDRASSPMREAIAAFAKAPVASVPALVAHATPFDGVTLWAAVTQLSPTQPGLREARKALLTPLVRWFAPPALRSPPMLAQMAAGSWWPLLVLDLAQNGAFDVNEAPTPY